MSIPSNKQSAFTLVELAIVIVIIGLLVGGVLTGQELIKQAKIRAQIKQLDSYDTASLMFKSKYNYLPGDFPDGFNIWGSACNDNSSGCDGNGDKSVGSISAIAAYKEPWTYFLHLSLSKMIKDSVRNSTVTGTFYSVGNNWPVNQFGTGVAVITLTDGLYYFIGPTIRNSTANLSAWTGNSADPAVAPEYASALDQKLDDGIPSQGKIRAIVLTGSTATNFGNDTVLNNCLGATNQFYNQNTDAITCRLVVKSKAD